MGVCQRDHASDVPEICRCGTQSGHQLSSPFRTNQEKGVNQSSDTFRD